MEKSNKLKNAGRFNITCEFGNMDVVQAYQFHKFMSGAIDNGIMAMKDSKSGQAIFTAFYK